MGCVRDIAETILVFCLTITAVFLIRYNEIRGSSVLIPVIWGLGAVLPRINNKSATSLLIPTRTQLTLSLKYYLLSTIAIFSLFAGGFLMYRRMGMPLPGSIVPSGVSLTEWIIYQFAFVGVFEELFFRGYIQTKFERVVRVSLSGEAVAFWLPIVGSAFLFAVAHVVVKRDPITLGVFFSGLLFGWLRAKTGSLIAPILSHGSANVFSMLLIRSFS